MRIEPVTLVGRTIRLEPLVKSHAPDLLEAARHDEIWTYLDEPTPQTLEDVETLISDAEHELASGIRLPFAIVESSTGRAIGSISLIDISTRHRSVEIGWAWLTPNKWSQGITTEATYLLLRHAFDDLGAVRVAFKADVRNERSQRAIEGMGGTREGVFRNHRILSNGYRRDSVYFSVIDTEWPSAQQVLIARLSSSAGNHQDVDTSRQQVVGDST